MTNKIFQLETLACPACAAKVESVVKKTKGVKEAEVLFNSSRVKFSFDESVVDTNTIKERIEKLGYKVLSEK